MNCIQRILTASAFPGKAWSNVKNVLTIIMAGGQGTRLSVLANRRAKPAVPFGGIYRIIDFALSNAMHSGARQMGIVTQYRPYSLADHVGSGAWWGLEGFGRCVKILSPHTGENEGAFYTNTADAIFHNIEFIERFPHCRDVLILSGDHIYKMDYRPMLELHRSQDATLTIACQEVPWEDTSRFGIMAADEDGRIRQFQEKPKENPLSNQASLGIYIFNRQALIRELKEDQANPESSHDFGRDIIPKMIHTEPVYLYPFEGYWRDVGTIASYMEASMDALDSKSGLDLHGWGIRTNHREIALHCQHASVVSDDANIKHSLISKGTEVHGEVINSIISPGVRVEPGARVENSILLNEVKIGAGAHLRQVIADKHVCVEEGVNIGDPGLSGSHNDRFPHLLNTGITVLGKSSVVGKGVNMGTNCLLYPGVRVGTEDGQPLAIKGGSTFFFDQRS